VSSRDEQDRRDFSGKTIAKLDLERARTLYRQTRHLWLAPGPLDAYERLALATVAAAIRNFAFFIHLKRADRKSISAILSEQRLPCRVLNARFDIEVETRSRISAESLHAYKTFRQRERFYGLGVWSIDSQRPAIHEITLSKLGSVLGYPKCCVLMDVQTKQQDHRLFLEGLVKEVGDNPDCINSGLRRKVPFDKASRAHLRRWGRRYELTKGRFPFVLHAACDECLQSSSSLTGLLNAQYEALAREVSEELHFLVRWAAHL
jgi:hypothetical protein